jgi:tetratricopeptide (TPR) repeat protein
MRLGLTAFTIIVAQTTASAQPSAEQLYDEGQQAYDRGDYTTAIARWQSSYDLSKEPLLVLNIAQAYRLAGDCTHALSTYRQYVALDPRSNERGLADDLCTELELRCGSTSHPLIDDPPHSTESAHTGKNLRLTGIVTGGAGVAMIATGLLFGNRASSLGDEVTNDCAVSCDWAVEKSKQSDGHRDATIGKALDGVGLAAVVVGVGMYIYGAREAQPALAIQPGTRDVTLTWSGRW